MNRLFSIDILRGLVMLLMTVDHTRDMFSTVSISEHLGTGLPWSYYFTRWITHFCAPTFVFLSGLSVALWMQKYQSTLRQSQLHIIKRGAVIALLDITLASILWSIIEKQPIFTIYLSELWVLGCGMILLALLLSFSARTIFLIGLAIVGTQGFLLSFYPPISKMALMAYGNGEFILIPGLCQIVANYPILPWFGLTCIGYSTGYYLIHTQHTMAQQTRLFITCAITSVCLFVFLRTFNIYGDMNSFIYHSSVFLPNVYSFLDLTKYPPSLQYFLVMLLLGWCTLAFRKYLDSKAHHPALVIIKHFGQAALLYYLLHLTLICLGAFLLGQLYPDQPIKTSNLFIIYGIAALVSITAYPILLSYKKLRDKYKNTYPLLGYI